MDLTNENTAYLKKALPFWNQLTEEQKIMIQNHVIPRTYYRGESMHGTSQHCAGLLLLRRGQLRVYIISESGKEITLYRLFDGDVCIFSASCMMKNINFEVYLETEQETDILLIPTKIYHQLNQTNIAVSDFTNQLMASRFSDVMWVMEQVLFTSFDKRLATFLLEQSAIDGSNRLNITHETIAKHMGSAREVVTRMLKYFQSENMVSLTRGEITLTDRKKLQNLAK
ncbi:MAG: Crp/Fnr family transcriptional regulator [Clostridiales bacterium]|nr:Crp/Fnr family transcriptional regulator [Clostridiales bacterium]